MRETPAYVPYHYYSSSQLAEMLGLSPRTVEAWRVRRTGPAYVRISPCAVRYRGADVSAWLAALIVTHEPTGSEGA